MKTWEEKGYFVVHHVVPRDVPNRGGKMPPFQKAEAVF